MDETQSVRKNLNHRKTVGWVEPRAKLNNQLSG